MESGKGLDEVSAISASAQINFETARYAGAQRTAEKYGGELVVSGFRKPWRRK
jgi:hypothetical protein